MKINRPDGSSEVVWGSAAVDEDQAADRMLEDGIEDVEMAHEEEGVTRQGRGDDGAEEGSVTC